MVTEGWLPFVRLLLALGKQLRDLRPGPAKKIWMRTHAHSVSSEDSQVSGGQITGKKRGFASEPHIWGNLELSVSAGSDSEWISFYEMIVSKLTY